MSKSGLPSLVGMLPVARDGDGVDVGTRDGPRESIRDGNGLALVRDKDGVGAKSKDLDNIDIVDEDVVDDNRLSLGATSEYMDGIDIICVSFFNTTHRTIR